MFGAAAEPAEGVGPLGHPSAADLDGGAGTACGDVGGDGPPGHMGWAITPRL
jgi:hypothetical protein